VFGVCANSYAPDDGRVVSVDHGCGAHSEALLPPGSTPAVPVIDELGYDLVDVPGVSVEETVFESFEHG
jgi:predicted ATPase